MCHHRKYQLKNYQAQRLGDKGVVYAYNAWVETFERTETADTVCVHCAPGKVADGSNCVPATGHTPLPGQVKISDTSGWTSYRRLGYEQVGTSGVCAVGPGSCQTSAGEHGDCPVLGTEEIPLLTDLQREDLFLASYSRRSGVGEAAYASHWFCARRCDTALSCRGFSFFENSLEVLRSKGEDSEHLGARKLQCVYFGSQPTQAQSSTSIVRGKCFVKVNANVSASPTACSPSHLVLVNPTGSEMSGTENGDTQAAPTELPGVATPPAQAAVFAVDVPPQFKLSLESKGGLFDENSDGETEMLDSRVEVRAGRTCPGETLIFGDKFPKEDNLGNIIDGDSAGLKFTFKNFEEGPVRCFVVVRGLRKRRSTLLTAGKYSIAWRLHAEADVEASYDSSASFILADRTEVATGISAATSLQTAQGVPIGLETITVMEGPEDPRPGFHSCAQILVGDLESDSLRMLDHELVESCHLQNCGALDPESEGDDISALPPPSIFNMSRGFHIVTPGLRPGGNTVSINQCDYNDFPLRAWNASQHALSVQDFKTVTRYGRSFYSRFVQGWNQNELWDPGTQCASAVKEEDANAEKLLGNADDEIAACAQKHSIWRGSRRRLTSDASALLPATASLGWWTYAHAQACVPMPGNSTTFESIFAAGVACLQHGGACGGVLGSFSSIKAGDPVFRMCDALTPISPLTPDTHSFVWVAGTLQGVSERCAAFTTCSTCGAAVGCTWVRTNSTLGLEGPGTCQTMRAPYIESQCDAEQVAPLKQGGNQCPAGRFTHDQAKERLPAVWVHHYTCAELLGAEPNTVASGHCAPGYYNTALGKIRCYGLDNTKELRASSAAFCEQIISEQACVLDPRCVWGTQPWSVCSSRAAGQRRHAEWEQLGTCDFDEPIDTNKNQPMCRTALEDECQPCPPCVDCVTMPGVPLLKRGYMWPMRTNVKVRFMSDEAPTGRNGKVLDKMAFQCPSEGSCLGEALFPPPMNKRTPARCAPGNSGPLCTLCLPGNYRASPESPCQECTTLLKLGFISAFAAVGLAVLLWVKVFAQLIDVTRIFHWWSNTSAQANLKILLGLAQVISSAPVTLDVTFPDVFRLVLEFLKLFSMSFTNLVVAECFSVLSGLYATLISRCVVIPSLIFGGLYVRFYTVKRGVLRAVEADNEPDRHSIDRLKASSGENSASQDVLDEIATIEERIKVREEDGSVIIKKLKFSTSSFAMLVLLFMYPMVSQILFRMWPTVCRELINGQDDGWAAESWHADDYRVDCTVGKHQLMTALSFVLIAALPCFVPYFFFHKFVSIMHAKRSGTSNRLRGTVMDYIALGSLKLDVANRTAAASTQTQTCSAATQTDEISSNYQRLQAHFSFMVSDYKPRFYYWEVLVMLQKMLLTAAIGVVRRGTGEQLVLAVLISMVFLILHIRCWPYVLEISNYIKLGVEVNIIIMYIVTLALRSDSRSIESDNMYGWVLVIVTVGLTPLSMLYAFFSLETKLDASNPDPSMVDSEDGDWVTIRDGEGNVLLEADLARHQSRRDLNSNFHAFKASKLQQKLFHCVAQVSLTAGVELPSTPVISLSKGQVFEAVEEWHCPVTGAIRCRGTIHYNPEDQQLVVMIRNFWSWLMLISIEHWHFLHAVLNASIYAGRKVYLAADHEWLCDYVVYISTVLLILQGIARRMKIPQLLVIYTFVLHIFIVMSFYNAAYWFVVNLGVSDEGEEIENTLVTQLSALFLVVLAIAERKCLAVYVARVVASDRCLHATHGSFEALPPSRWGPDQCREWLESSFSFLRDGRLATFNTTGRSLLAMDAHALREQLIPDSSSSRRKVLTGIGLLKEEETLATILSLVGVREGHPDVDQRWDPAFEKRMNRLLGVHAVLLIVMLWEGMLATDTAFVEGWPPNSGGPRPVAAIFNSIAVIVTVFFFFVLFQAVRAQDQALFAVVLQYKRPYLLVITVCSLCIPGLCIFGTEADASGKGIGTKETNAIISRLYLTIVCAAALMCTVSATTSAYEESMNMSVQIRADANRVQLHMKRAGGWFSGLLLLFLLLRVSFMIDSNGLTFTEVNNVNKIFNAVLIACGLGLVYAGLGHVCLTNPRPSFVALHGLIHTLCVIAFEASTLGLTILIVFGVFGVPIVGANKLVRSAGRFVLIFWWLGAAISGGLLVRGAVQHSIDPTPAQHHAPPQWKARLRRLLTFYFCFWFPFVMWPLMPPMMFFMMRDPGNFKDGADEILWSCCFATGVETFVFMVGMMAVYNKLPLFPALQAAAAFGATLFFVPFGLMHFTFVVGAIFNAAIRIPSCSANECLLTWISFGGWCMYAFLALCQVIIICLYFVSMHQNGSIKGFIEAIVALFEKETAAPVQDQKSKDNARSSDRDDVRRFENPLSDDGQQDAMSKYASAGVIGIIAAHELITDASVFGD